MKYSWFSLLLSSLSGATTIKTTVALLAVGFIMVMLIFTKPNIEPFPQINVAFIGNSIMFTYDLPRLIEAMAVNDTTSTNANNATTSSSSVYQNSCLHGSGNLQSQLERGNGMYVKFNKPNAYMEDNGYIDYGSCTITQLLTGYDENLYENNDYYYDDGLNPCLQDENYAEYLYELYQTSGKTNWDYVVINDQTVYPALYERRQTMLETLENSYVPLLSETPNARPVLLSTYGYNHSYSNLAEELGNVAEFTSHVYYGYQQYAQVLARNLPDSQAPLVAPVGLAYLTIYEEDYGMWKRLFYYDHLHPSPHGSYLIGCVLFATLYQRMPSPHIVISDHLESSLWGRSRKYQVLGSGKSMSFPTRSEAQYLYRIAERVVLAKYVPRTLLSQDEIIELETPYRNEYYNNNNNNNDDYNDDDDDGR